jgi:hypothetical protein
MAVRTPTNTPSLPTNGAILSAAIPIAGVGDGEDRLIQHQDQDHGRRRDPDLGAQLWQVDDVSGPAQREDELQHGKIDAGAVGAGIGLGRCL